MFKEKVPPLDATQVAARECWLYHLMLPLTYFILKQVWEIFSMQIVSLFKSFPFMISFQKPNFASLHFWWHTTPKFDSCPSVDDDILPQTWPMVCKQFWVDFYCCTALLMEHSAFLYWNFLLHIFPYTKRKFPAASLKGAPQKSTTFKGHEDWELRVKREKQIAHICSDDDAKKCLLINLIMVINCHQIPLLRWASENSKPANVSKARKIFSYLTS